MLATFIRKLMPLRHWAWVMVVGHCVGVMVLLDALGPEGVVEMRLLSE
jgi:hypothetical protein